MTFRIRQGVALAWLSGIIITSTVWEISSVRAIVPEDWETYDNITETKPSHLRENREESMEKPANHDVIAQVYYEHFEEHIRDKLDNVPCRMVLGGTDAEEWVSQIAKLTRLVVKAVLEIGDDVDTEVHCPHPSGCKEFEDEEYCGCSPLYLAMMWADAELVRLAIERGVDMNVTCGDEAPLEKGRILSSLLSLSNSWDIIRLAIDNETDINAIQDDKGETLLHKWARNGMESVEDTMDYLQRRGLDINRKNSAGDSALLISADNVPADMAYDGDDKNFWEGKNVLAKYLLNYGADVEVRNNKSWTSLHIATLNCNVGLVRMLLESGADVSSKTNDGKTALHVAMNYKRFIRHRNLSFMTRDELVLSDNWKHMFDTDFPNRLFILPSYCTNLTVPRLLFEAGADVNSKQKDDWTPLHLAVYFMQFDATKLLLDNGANVNVQDALGCSPLHLAVMKSDRGRPDDISVLLIQHKANVNAKQTNGWTPLHLAVFYGYEPIAKVLIREGADVNAKQHKGWTPWMIANRMDRHGMVEMLENYGAEKRAFFSFRNSVRRLWGYASKLFEEDLHTDPLTSMLLYDGLIGLWTCKTSYSELFDH